MGQANVPAAEVFWMTKLYGWEMLTFWAFLLENDERKVLLNTGFPKNYSALKKHWTTWAQSAMNEPGHDPIVHNENWIVNALSSIDIIPDDITDVLISPITSYATGGLDQFHNARLWMSRRGWVDFHAPDPEIPQLPRHIFFPEHVLQYLVESKNAARINLMPDVEKEIIPGIFTWFCGGHHRSSMAIKVQTEIGIIGLTDAIFKYRNYEENIPLGLSESLEEHHRMFAKMKRDVDLILPLYDPAIIDKYPSLKIG